LDRITSLDKFAVNTEKTKQSLMKPFPDKGCS
jgi:hypothetical protein